MIDQKKSKSNPDAFIELGPNAALPRRTSFGSFVFMILLGLGIVSGLTFFDRTEFDKNMGKSSSNLGATVKLASGTKETEANDCTTQPVDFLQITWCPDDKNNLTVTSSGEGFLVIVQGKDGGANQFPGKEEAFTVQVPIYERNKFKLTAKSYEVALECGEDSENCSIIWPE